MTTRPALCILFLHHRDDAVTRHHLALLRRSNPDAWIVPLVDAPFGAMLGSIDVSQFDTRWNTTNKWRSSDTMVYRWFRQRSADADRYLILEYDCRVDVDLLDYYGPWLDADVVLPRWREPDRDLDWTWFREVPLLDDDDRAAAAGVTPMAGLMFTHQALASLCATVTSADVISELRVGTAIRRAGLRFRELDGVVRRRIDSRPFRGLILRPGLYHPVKVVHHNRHRVWCVVRSVRRRLTAPFLRIAEALRRALGRPA